MSKGYLKQAVFFTALMIVSMKLSAASIDVATAKSTAQRFSTTIAANGRHMSPRSTTDLVLIYTESSQAVPGQADYYIFNTGDSFIIVPGDDRAEDVLAYGDSPLDMNNLPDGMKYWLDGFKKQMEHLLANPSLEILQGQRRAPARQGESIEPLLTATWDQGSPYNLECPASKGSRCVTGCPATSLSMVFYYWKYPTDSTPSVPGYVTESLKLRLEELPPTQFDWDNMLDSYRRGYNSDQAHAVAKLMRYLGQAELMDYTPSASGSYGENILETAILFGYSPEAEIIYKSAWDTDEVYYSDEEWAYIIQDELSARRPIVMCAYAHGMNGISGHAFNVDGYDADRDMYHINWGWSGSSNGYFALNAFRGGSSTYNICQQLIIGVEPPITVPTIKAKRSFLSVSSYVDHTAELLLNVKGFLLTGDVTLTLNDANGVFSLKSNRISCDKMTDFLSIPVYFNPTAVGTYQGSITLSSEGAKDVTISLQGNAILETYDPVMDVSDVDASSISANWSDKTPSHNVTSYNLEVAKVPYSELRLKESFTHLSSGASQDYSTRLDDITSNAGWTGDKVYVGDGNIRLGNGKTKGWLETPSLDMRDNKGTITVKVKAKTTGNETNALLKISCGESDTTILVIPGEQEYCVLLTCPSNKDVKARLTNSVANLRVIITGVEVLAGDDYSPVDASTIVNHEGITGKTYWINGLNPGTYAMRVQAVYTDGNVSQWSNRTRAVVQSHKGDVNFDGAINISDLNTVINVVLNSTASRGTFTACDLNGDGVVNIADINALIHLILNGQ